ncbi:MAG: NAD(P)H-hydrate epimerase [Planctomycetes bacterium]|nr:NAD(P)H-hydrate epimerase [Planctomycetota bacterium]
MNYEAQLQEIFGGPVHLTAEQLHRVDRMASEELGLPSLLLMENAGIHAAQVALKMLPESGARAVIFCGTGNNGGDGYVIARQLHLCGVKVQVLFGKEIHELQGDAMIQAQVARKLGIEMTPLFGTQHSWFDCHLAIDALLGTGLQGPLRMEMREALEGINRACRQHSIRTLAIDLPSGLNADTGAAAPSTFIAEKTVTFVARKRGFSEPCSHAFTGIVQVVPIGVPAEFVFKTLRSE